MAKCKNLRTGVGLEGNGMTDRERLIDLMIEAKRTDPETGSFTDYLADYLIEHGVIVLPCKVGDTFNINSAPYNSNLSLVKALDVDTGKPVCGFYSLKDKGCFIHNFFDPYSEIQINPYTVCRNSGIKDKNGKFVFENDLLKLTHSLKSTVYGYLVWDEFYRSWKIRRRTDITAYINIDEFVIESIGNIVLSDDDLSVILEQEKEEDSQGTFIDNSYCPSKFKK